MERLENMLSWFHEQPQRILNFGSSCFTFGFILLITGLWSRVANQAADAMNRMAKLQLEASLATSYPNFPTWWIPESLVGQCFSILLITYGVGFKLYGRKLIRINNL